MRDFNRPQSKFSLFFRFCWLHIFFHLYSNLICCVFFFLLLLFSVFVRLLEFACARFHVVVISDPASVCVSDHCIGDIHDFRYYQFGVI